jgi:quinol-cytochrome oxidoreductase complex cytochrome b subunit
MKTKLLASIINLNQPQHYFHWSIFTISVANLIIIALMVVIFGLAIILPFPKSKIDPPDDETLKNKEAPVSEDTKRMWTYKVRHFFLGILPPEKLLPDRQPAYVASWIYVFGVATLAALGLVILSGIVLAVGGVSWWHESSLGHFVNSIHLWSVELFMAFMVIHLWGKFWMAAWRGKRALTWMTGVLAFAVSILEAFSGYLSQQNFDAQWIATNGKDAINSTGLGSFFNLMNFGQMLTWHIILIPLALIAFVVIHVLLVRVRGVTHPIQKAHGRAERKALKAAEAAEWRGPTRRYDILKEGVFATIIVLILVITLAGTLSSPDEPPVTVGTWAKIAPADFMATAASELAGTSETATYGPPYNSTADAAQKLVISWQSLAGVHQPIKTAQAFVLDPLSTVAPGNQNLQAALNQYNSASATQQQSWVSAYSKAVTKVTFKNGAPSVPKTNAGPVPVLIANELAMAQSGAIDTDLLSQTPFYGTNYTKPLLFIEDGNYFSSLAQAEHLTGEQWGVMNETGSYPGQPWLWLYTLWYQIPTFSASANVDLIAIYLTGLGTMLLLFVPFIPGLRDIPKLIPVHRLIWRQGRGSKQHKPQT